MKASNLLYGERRRGTGPKKVNDVTDLFFQLCLSWSWQKRLAAAQHILACSKGTSYKELYALSREEDLNDELRTIAYNKNNYAIIRPIMPRRNHDGDRWVIDLMATNSKPFCRARIEKVIERDGKLVGSACFYEQSYIGKPHSYTFDQLRNFDSDRQGDCYLDLVDFIDEVAAATLRAIHQERKGNDQEAE